MTGIRPALARDLRDLAVLGRLRHVPDEDLATDPGHITPIDFCSNDYLGLAGCPELAARAAAAALEFGAGAGASRLLGGGSAVHRRVERAAAKWLAIPGEDNDGLLFASGYQANVGLLGAVAGSQDAIFSDAENHASIIDGCRLSRATVEVFAHNDLDELAGRLQRHRERRRRVVVTEGVFSMSGDRAPIERLLRACAQADAWLIVDEAHAIGLLGPEGAGTVADALARDPSLCSASLLARVITGGKALGVAGAIVVGPSGLRETLLNRARSQVFSTAAAPAAAGAFLAAIERVRGADDLRHAALRNAGRLARGLGLPHPDACIVPLVIGDDGAAMTAAAHAQASGFDVRAVRPPTVATGTARLRLVARASHTAADIDKLCHVLNHLHPSEVSCTRPSAPSATPLSATPPSATPPSATMTVAVRETAPQLGIGPTAARDPSSPRALFVVGTDTGVGKTVASAGLLRAARRFVLAHYWKPVQTGDEDDTTAVATLADTEVPYRPGYAFPLPASPHEAARSAGQRIDSEWLSLTLDAHRRSSELLLVEPAGGLMVPLVDHWTQLDWIAREGAPVVLVARSGLGTLNHTLLSLAALASRSVEVRGLVLCGEPHPSNRDTLQAFSATTLIVELPALSPLSTASLDRWIDRHESALREMLSL